jgi:hypothetical protein
MQGYFLAVLEYVAKSLRMVLGSLIIQTKYSYSDKELVSVGKYQKRKSIA